MHFGVVCPLVLDDPARVGLLGAELVANRLRAGRALRIALPTGRTPLGMYAALRIHAREGSLPAADATVFQLDEYAGVGHDDDRSFAAELRRELDGMHFGSLALLDGAAGDLEAECTRHQRLLDQSPLDLAVLGLGRDGHIAFDEPGSPPDAGMRRVMLADVTRQDAAQSFGGVEHVPRQAITVGLRTLRNARRIVLLVTGAAKAPALRAMLEGPLTDQVPASVLRDHPRLTVICDRAAASGLRPRPGSLSDRAVVVLGHRDPGVSAEHRASAESHARLQHAADLVRRDPVRAVVLTGWTQTGGLSEAEQMLAWWSEPSTPAIMEVAGRNTAENASRSLPLLTAMGAIRRVTVVTSAWHIRAPWFFRPYRHHGLAVDYSPAALHGRWGPMLAREARELRHARRERREAFAALSLPPAPEALG